MDCKWNSSPHPISDIRDWNNANRLEIQPDFQRKEVWSESAKIMLMDTILKNIPMPKIYIEAIIKSDNTYRIIIDGQQRIKAILAFLRGDLRLTNPYDGEYKDCAFEALPPEVQDNFLSYKIDFNEITNASNEFIREIFSRINKYNIALNKQELRRADFPGDFLDLAEDLSQHDFFEESMIFSVASRKRMGDVEYISELLTILIEGPQEKRESLDQFYQDYQQWDKDNKDEITTQFKKILDDILLVFPADSFPISKTRFKQRADFYSLFAAIHELHVDSFSLQGKSVDNLREDFKIINNHISPNSEVYICSEYAIKCVSQGNTLASRKWRKLFLKNLLKGTYVDKPPETETSHLLKAIGSDANLLPICENHQKCKICNTLFDNDRFTLGWDKSSTEFQLSNSHFVHTECISKTDDYVFAEEKNDAI